MTFRFTLECHEMLIVKSSFRTSKGDVILVYLRQIIYQFIMLLTLSLLCSRITLYFGCQLSNSDHEVGQLSEKLSSLEIKMHDVSNHIHGQLQLYLIMMRYIQMTGYPFVAIFL